MKTSTRFSLTWAYVAGALTVATGLVHDAMIHVPLSDVESLSADVQHGVLWLFLCTGTAVAFAGALNISAVRSLVRGESWARRLTMGSCLFMSLLGVVGLVVGEHNAWILVALAAISLVPWWLTRHAGVASLLGRSIPATKGLRGPEGLTRADESRSGGAR